MKITWIGHSCFKIEQNGYSIITDPYAPGSVPGLSEVKEKANLVLCSHKHGDHSYAEGVRIEKATAPKPQITEYAGWHDEVRGAKRGPNTIRIMDFAGFRLAHLGDIGCNLTAEQQKALNGVDVLMIPVGGFYTIDARQAAEITKQLKPHYVIPMHYRDQKGRFGYDVIGTAVPFVKAMGRPAINVGETFETDDIPTEANHTQVILMTPQNIR